MIGFNKILDIETANHIGVELSKYFHMRMFCPNISVSEATKALENILSRWKKEKKWICFTQGCYDMMHPNHYLKLVLSKRVACAAIALKTGINYDQLVKQDLVRLLVSLDGDEGIRANRLKLYSNIRPVDSWLTRAFRLLTLLDIDGIQTLPLVDGVTVHDKFLFSKTSYESPLALVKHLANIDFWLISDENTSLLLESNDVDKSIQVISTPRFEQLTALLGDNSSSSTVILEKFLNKIRNKL